VTALLTGPGEFPARPRDRTPVFYGSLADGEPASLLTMAVVSDCSDGQIAHLHGLNLSRAWCFRSVPAPRDRRRLNGHPLARRLRGAAVQLSSGSTSRASNVTNRSRSASRSSALTATWVAPAAANSLTFAAMSRAGLPAEA
jgi:DUF2891 family protein